MSTTYSQRHRRQTNVNEKERIASLIAGGALMTWGLKKGSFAGFLTAAAGGALAARGATGHCYIYEALGTHSDQRSGRSISVPYETGIRIDKVITVNKPQNEVYQFWRNLENLSKFMNHLESVKEIDNKHSHWVAKGLGGTSVQWRAEIINEKENELIGWRSLPGADVPNAGSVQFKPAAGGRGTEVKIELQYDPPGGNLVATLAKLIGQDPERQIEDDLRRFKQLMETGEIITTEGQPVGQRTLASNAARKPEPKKGWNRDVVTTASEESFPASDPPSWTPETLSSS
jgi:uncharacterized membrane protein